MHRGRRRAGEHAPSAPVRDTAARDELIEQYLPLVRYVVARLPVTMPATLDRDDFYSVGVMGLIHAACCYDPDRGATFKTFAFTAIRGAILDEIRRHDPVPVPSTCEAFIVLGTAAVSPAAS